jgi:hypothetical protein
MCIVGKEKVKVYKIMMFFIYVETSALLNCGCM